VPLDVNRIRIVHQNVGDLRVLHQLVERTETADLGELLLEVLTAVGIAALMYAAVELVREARLSRRMMRLRCRPLQQRLAQHGQPPPEHRQREGLSQSPFQ